MDIYLIAIGGTGMAPLACLLQEQGHRVRGADGPLYPPMSTLLEAAGVRPHVGWDPAHLEPRPDLVVVGNAVPRSNPEAQEAERLGIERLSMPEALGRFFLAGRRPLVIAGTHGKTTTTALASWVWSRCGADPGYLIGGVPLGLPASFRAGGGERFIVEGDEYNAAYFDRGPKFLHYRPETVILTGVEHDHADLYPDPESLYAAFGRLLALPAEGGLAVVCGDSAEARRLAAGARCRVLFYGLGAGNDVAPVGGVVEPHGEGTRLRVADAEAGEVELTLRLPGRHNAENALAVWAAARADGLPAAAVAAALSSFAGVKRRQEELGSPGGVTVVDDFAHHPTAVERTVEALAGRYPGRRLTVLFEPRSLTAGRAFLLPAYQVAFAGADRVLLAPVFHAGRLAPDERLDTAALAAALCRRGVDARAFESNDALLAAALAGAAAGDVLTTMSSGSFDGMPQRLVAALAAL
jgi:UDP-N-acetylmuramate: L-alanyl-gamma-D-glutamyl-meso-diaminopimelate ligase